MEERHCIWQLYMVALLAQKLSLTMVSVTQDYILCYITLLLLYFIELIYAKMSWLGPCHCTFVNQYNTVHMFYQYGMTDIGT